MQEIFDAIKKSALEIDSLIKRGETSKATTINNTGDTQLKLDIKSDIIIENNFKNIKSIKSIISEEKEQEVFLHKDGEYLIGYDPLDGSSLVDVNLSIGSIFGIYKNNYHGSSLVASVYVVYGPRLELVIGYNKKVEMYRFSKTLYRKKENYGFKFITQILLDQKGNLNASGATQKNWFSHHKQLIERLFANGYRLRYSGGMVPDLHAILLKGGGLFSYPATTDKPKGKLRMVFEVFPFAMIYELAGGEAIDSKGSRLLSHTPSHLHDTIECFFGSKDECKLVREYYL